MAYFCSVMITVSCLLIPILQIYFILAPVRLDYELITAC